MSHILPGLPLGTKPTTSPLKSRLKNFLMGWLLVLGLKEDLVECATLWVKSEVILACVSETEIVRPIALLAGYRFFQLTFFVFCG